MYDRAATCLYPQEDERRTAAEALRSILFGPWSAEGEAHYEHLKQELVELRNVPADEPLAQGR